MAVASRDGPGRWGCPPVAAATAAAPVTGSTGGSGAALPRRRQRGDRQGLQPVRHEGRHAPLRQCGDWTPSTRATLLRPLVELPAQLRPHARSSSRPARAVTGTKLVPDLARCLGKPSDDGKTWTFTLNDGVKFEDGTPITSKDIKYGIERSSPRTTFPRADVLHRLPRTSQRLPARTRTRTPTSSEVDRDAGRQDDHLQAQASRFSDFDYLRAAAADGPGAAGQGHRHEVQGASRSRPARTSSSRTSRASRSTRPQHRTRRGDRPRLAQGAAGQARPSPSASTRTTSTTGCMSR